MVPMLGYIMAKDMTPKQIGDLQKFADFGDRSASCPRRSTSPNILQKF